MNADGNRVPGITIQRDNETERIHCDPDKYFLVICHPNALDGAKQYSFFGGLSPKEIAIATVNASDDFALDLAVAIAAVGIDKHSPSYFLTQSDTMPEK